MAKVKKGDYLSCRVCGLVVVVNRACGCAATMVICCSKPMVIGKATADRIKKAGAAVKAVKNPVKPVAKAAPAKAAAKASGKAAPARPAAKASGKAAAKSPAKPAAKAKPAGKKPVSAKK